MLPLIIHEDDHLLVVNKPAGMNTHAPAAFASEGIYDWLRDREPRWASLAIIHRLDKETSGVIVFGKTPIANRSLTDQFTRRAVAKRYLFLTDREPSLRQFSVRSNLVRAGERYRSGPTGEFAETHFRVVRDAKSRNAFTTLEAEPLTGRTHQIRVHAAESGIPILGDILYGGSRFQRVCLHAAKLTFEHPTDRREISFTAPASFNTHPSLALRRALIDPAETDAVRFIHGASDGWAGWYVDRLANYFLSQSETPLTREQREFLESVLLGPSPPGWPATGHERAIRGYGHAADESREPQFTDTSDDVPSIYHKTLTRHVRGKAAEASPVLVTGPGAPARFVIRENGLKFEISFDEGYSTGLFLDQRDNRRRWLSGHIAAGFELCTATESARELRVLNVFAYTCGFSVCAAKAGALVTSLDLSKKYLDRGRQNFALNGLDPDRHHFIFGDAFDWMRRLAKKGRTFDGIILDPPTFSQSKASGVFRAERDFGTLVSTALPLLVAGGVLFASSNAAAVRADAFAGMITGAIVEAGRKIVQQHYAPQPPDFPISRAEPAHLKTLWLRVG